MERPDLIACDICWEDADIYINGSFCKMHAKGSAFHCMQCDEALRCGPYGELEGSTH